MEKKSDSRGSDFSRDCHIDEEGVLLEPYSERGEIAVLNPSLYQNSNGGPWPFTYRVRRNDELGNEFSTIDYALLKSPTELDHESKTLLVPEYDYESKGCEDGRLTRNGDYILTYIAYDGLNAVPAMATTKDFSKVEKHGMLGPNISIEEAIELVDDIRYRKLWVNELRHRIVEKENKRYSGEIMLYNKDASMHFNESNKKWTMIYRLEPNMQKATSENLDDFKDKNFWREQIRELEKNTILKSDVQWSGEKIGLGSPPIEVNGRLISLFHGVEKLGNYLVYRGGFLEFDEDYNVISKLRDPLFNPHPKRDVLYEQNKDGIMCAGKAVNFPTALLQSPVNSETLWTYSGLGDKKIGYRSTDLSWLFGELSSDHNLIK
jgi:beta-1,2-mannobiose phosphorylase / 1,2-beta-oligomannan phosphorylase